jgi:thiazole synthase
VSEKLKLYDKEFSSRMLLGTSRYPSPATLLDCIKASATEIITVSLRRESSQAKSGQKFWDIITANKSLNLAILPNTAGCYSVKEAVLTAHMARELFDTRWIKLEVIGDDYTLQPDPYGLLEAAKILIADGFHVFPYMNDDLIVAEKLLAAGCQVLMPWASPIGSGRGVVNPYALDLMRKRYPEVPMIVDAGIGRPSDAVVAMELGYDAVLLNTAVACAGHPVTMATAFKQAIEAGRLSYQALPMERRQSAVASTPVTGKATYDL